MKCLRAVVSLLVVTVALMSAHADTEYTVIGFTMQPDKVHPGDRIILSFNVTWGREAPLISLGGGDDQYAVAWLDNEPRSLDVWRTKEMTGASQFFVLSTLAPSKRIQLALKAPDTLGEHKLEIVLYSNDRSRKALKQLRMDRDSSCLSPIHFTVEPSAVQEFPSRNSADKSSTLKLAESPRPDMQSVEQNTRDQKPAVKETQAAHKQQPAPIEQPPVQVELKPAELPRPDMQRVGQSMRDQKPAVKETQAAHKQQPAPIEQPPVQVELKPAESPHPDMQRVGQKEQVEKERLAALEKEQELRRKAQADQQAADRQRLAMEQTKQAEEERQRREVYERAQKEKEARDHQWQVKLQKEEAERQQRLEEGRKMNERIRLENEQRERERQRAYEEQKRARAEMAHRQQESLARQQQQEEMQRQQAQAQVAQQDAMRRSQGAAAAGMLLGMMAQGAQEREAREQAEREQAAREQAARQREEARTTLTWRLRSSHPNIVHVHFYSLDRDALWPANDRVYTLNDSEVHEMTIRGQPGERVCYGAWVSGNPDIAWGAGKDKTRNPDPNHIYRIGGGETSIISLMPPANHAEHATPGQQETTVELNRQGGIIDVRLGSEEKQRKKLRDMLPTENELPASFSYNLHRMKKLKGLDGIQELSEHMGGNPGVTEDRQQLDNLCSSDAPFWDKSTKVIGDDLEAMAAGACGSEDGAAIFFAFALKNSNLGSRVATGIMKGGMAADYRKESGNNMHILNAQRFVLMFGFTDKVREGAYKDFVQTIISRLQRDEQNGEAIRVIREGSIVQPPRDVVK